MFNNISDAEFTQLKDAIAQITVYIAGADGKIDQEEKDWATKLTKIRGFASDELLNDFYEAVGEDYADKLTEFIDCHGENPSAIEDSLSALNSILAKLDNGIGAHLYKSYVSFAKHVAKASGGFLGFASISAAEKKLIGLSMIDPIELEAE